MHADDAMSLAAMIQEARNTDTDEGNIVLLCKFQSEHSYEHKVLQEKDFMIVIQTSLQKEMLREFAPNRVVCMDSTHGTNVYRFYLITVLVVDDFGEGLPVAWCLSNREDEQAGPNLLFG